MDEPTKREEVKVWHAWHPDARLFQSWCPSGSPYCTDLRLRVSCPECLELLRERDAKSTS